MNFQKIVRRKPNKLFNVSLSLMFFLPYLIQNKPIWIDEFLHLSISSYTSLSEAFNITLETLKTVNHGQTGFYILCNWFLIEFLGFNKYSLRFPSIVGLLIVLYAINVLISRAKLTVSQSIFLMITIAGNYNLSQYISEARPYYPLAASNFALFIYLYLFYVHKKSVRSLFLIASLFGVFMHPYFIAYFLLLVSINMLLFYKISSRILPKNRNDLIREFKRFILPISIIVSIISLLFYEFAWGNRTWDISRDPFEFSGEKLQFIIYFFSGNFSFFSFAQIMSYNTFFIICIILVFALYYLIVLYLVLFIRDSKVKFFIGMNFGIVIFISILISLLSYLNSYWILTRQWVGSAIIIMFLLFLIYLHSEAKLKKILYFSMVLIFLTSIIYQVRLQYEWIEENNQNKLKFISAENNYTENLTVNELVGLANWNLENRKVKSDIFTQYYDKKMYE